MHNLSVDIKVLYGCKNLLYISMMNSSELSEFISEYNLRNEEERILITNTLISMEEYVIKIVPFDRSTFDRESIIKKAIAYIQNIDSTLLISEIIDNGGPSEASREPYKK